MVNEIYSKLQNILSSFLGEPKHDVNEKGQIEYPCPRCVESYGEGEIKKYNLSINIHGKFQCWKCCATDDEMSGSLRKLFKLYGTESLWQEYVAIVTEYKKSELYQLRKENKEFQIDDFSISPSLQLPPNYKKFNQNGYNPKVALDYLFNRGIDWDIINEYNIGYTEYDRNNKEVSTRIIIPSYNEYDELNYWTGRDYSGLKFKQKYFNPTVERKDIIFNENKIQWDADINLCEGPFDAIVLPNSIPLLGKALKTNYEIYRKIMLYANAKVNIFLDGDASKDVKTIYRLLNQGRLQGKIRYIPVENAELDPSKIFELYNRKGIIQHLKNAKQFNEFELLI